MAVDSYGSCHCCALESPWHWSLAGHTLLWLLISPWSLAAYSPPPSIAHLFGRPGERKVESGMRTTRSTTASTESSAGRTSMLWGRGGRRDDAGGVLTLREKKGAGHGHMSEEHVPFHTNHVD